MARHSRTIFKALVLVGGWAGAASPGAARGDAYCPLFPGQQFPAGMESVVVADLDGDGCLDAAVAPDLGVLLGNCDGSFRPRVHYPTGGGGGDSGYVAAADLDGDGDIDLAVTAPSQPVVSVLRSNGDGTFAPYVTYATGG